MRLALASTSVALLLLACAACGGSSGPSTYSAGDMRASVTRFVAAFDQRNAAAACAEVSNQAWDGEAQTLAKIFGSKPTCTRWVAKDFTVQESESGSELSPRYTSVKVVKWLGSSAGGGYGREVAVIKGTYADASPSSAYLGQPVRVAFWFTHEGGAVKLAQYPAIDRAITGDASQPLENLHPIPAGDLGRAAPVNHPGFACTGAAQTWRDVQGDTMAGSSEPYHRTDAPWVDIRSVTVRGLHGSAPCVDVEFGRQVRPDTEVYLGGPTAAVGADGDFWLMPGFRGVGETGDTLVLGLVPEFAAEIQEPLTLCATTTSIFDPLVSDLTSPFDGFEAGSPAAAQNTPC